MRVICAWCKKIIKHEDGTGGLDSHGICPACQDSHYPVTGDQVIKEKHRLQTCATGGGIDE
jgi:hypothetical protein